MFVTPYLYPYWYLTTDGAGNPPINPTLLVLLILAAITPTKYADSSSLNTTGMTFSCIVSYVSSNIANFCSG